MCVYMYLHTDTYVGLYIVLNWNYLLVVVSNEHGDELSGSIKGGTFFY
jgi:hypothetical protein